MSLAGGYGAVPQSDPEGHDSSTNTRRVDYLPLGFVAFISGAKDDAHTTPREQQSGHEVNERGVMMAGGAKLEFKVASEAWRFIAYLFFWGMCFFAIAMTKIFVTPSLAAGPPSDSPTKTCPPFEPNGEGFDIAENSHLRRAFGFNNVSSFVRKGF